MHMFSRVGVFTGDIRSILDWATEITAKVNMISETEVTLWGGTFGYPLGTLAWTTVVESRQQLTDQAAKLTVDDGYLDLAAKGQEFSADGGTEDSLRNLIHATVEADAPPGVGAEAQITTAVPAAGKMAEAMEWGVSIADRFTSITGAGVAFLLDEYGPFGQMTWMSACDDSAATEAANEATMNDADYMAAINDAGHLFEPGTGFRRLVTRLA